METLELIEGVFWTFVFVFAVFIFSFFNFAILFCINSLFRQGCSVTLVESFDLNAEERGKDCCTEDAEFDKHYGHTWYKRFS